MHRRPYLPAWALLLALLPLHGAVAGIAVQVSGVKGELKQAVSSALQMSRYADREVTSPQAHRLARLAPDQAAQALRPYGYYHAEAKVDLKQTPKGWTAQVTVQPGEPVSLSKLQIDIPDVAAKLPPVRRAIKNFKPREGQRLDQSQYEKSKSVLQSALTETGFLDARMSTHKIELSLADNRAQAHIVIKPGPRYRYGATQFEGSQFAEGFLQRYVPWEKGDYFSQRQLLALQQQLIDADYFSIVNVDLGDEDAQEGVIPIIVHLAPAKRTVYTGGIFVGTDTGPGIRGGVQRRWINRHGHKLSFDVLAATRLKTASVLYNIPLPGHDERSFNFGINYRDENTDTSKSKTFALVANETRQWYGFTRTIGVHLLTGDFTVADEKGSSTLLYPEASLAKKKLDNPLFVRHGWSVNFTARAAPPGLLSDTSFTQLLASGKWIDAFTRRNRLIVRADLGATWVQDFSKLPPQLRFFAGGDRSIRGYSYQSIGPRNENDDVIGGKNLAVGSVELEHYFTHNWGMAVFVDGGDAFSDTSFDMKIGAGVGLRWLSPVGLVRLDLGTPIRDDRKSGVQLHLVIGPDL